MSEGNSDEKSKEVVKETKKPLLGKNPRVSSHRTSTDVGKEGDRATAKSIFRNQTKGQKVVDDKFPDKLIRRSENGTNIRFNTDGSTRIDLPNRGTQPNGETIHFNQ
ncbi:MAG: hypothetical protein GW748_00865 [Alphaproteobacteria bacterium]|nr:hypothetical protein [Alphaproteobacteria bacterium]NCQ66285.1 hypothetical protein [Alphaproteobacteria bacterium]NCT06771.1 hypothetical protein [Alphaproteobacteria bacterium]